LVEGGIRTTISTAELRLAQNRIEVEEKNRNYVLSKRDVAVDSLRSYQRKILELDNNADVAGELGPLKYLQGLTGYPMDKIINILLLVIIFVFDPLAVALVIAANFTYNQAFPRTRENLYGERVPLKKQSDYWDRNSTSKPVTEKILENEERMNIIGQNRNEGIHYEGENIVDTNKDGIITQDEISSAIDRIKHLESSIAGVTRSSNRVDKALKEIKKLKSGLPDDLTITY
jgi:hypothetical protein